MWTAERRGRRHGTHGYSLVEVVMVMAVLGGLSALTSQALTSVRDSTDTLASYRRAQRGGERLAYQIHGLASTARKLYVRGIAGNDYLTAIDLSRRPPAPNSRLPLTEEYEPLGRDSAGVPQTGNVMLLATETDPVTCLADPATAKILYLDLYRMLCVYPSETRAKVVVRRAENGLDLVIWASAAYPSYVQVSSIANAAERTRVVRALYSTHGCRYLWNPDLPSDQAFFAIDATGSIAGLPETGHEMPEDAAVSPGGRLIQTKLQLARTDPAVWQRRAVLTVENPEEWVPNGFELKVVGTSSQRKVWMRLTVEAQSVTPRDTAHDTTLIASLRDL